MRHTRDWIIVLLALLAVVAALRYGYERATEVGSVQALLSVSRLHVEEVQKALRQVREERARLQRENLVLAQRATTAEERYLEERRTDDPLRRTIEQLSADRVAREARLAAAAADLAKARSDAGRLSGEQQQLRDQLAAREARIDTLQKEAAAGQNARQQAAAERDAARKDAAAQKARADALQAKIAAGQTARQQATAERDAARKDAAAQKARADALQAKVDELSSAARRDSALQRQLDETRKQLEAARRELAEVKK